MRKILILISLLFSSACVANHGSFTVLSNKLVDVQDFELDKADRVKHVKGKDTSHIIIFIPTNITPTLGGAITDALTKADGDVMTDVTVNSWSWYVPYLYGYAGWSVEGDVVKTRKK